MKPCTANGTGRPSFTTTVDGVTIACNEISSARSDAVTIRGMNPRSIQAGGRGLGANLMAVANEKDSNRSAVEIRVNDFAAGFLALLLNIRGGVFVVASSCAPLG